MLVELPNSDYSKVRFPFINFNMVFFLLYFLYKKDGGEVNKNKILNETNLSVSAITNSATIAFDLGLIDKFKGIYKITDVGKQLIEHIINDNISEVKAIGQKLIINLKKSPVLYTIFMRYKENPKMSLDTLGRSTAFKFNHGWKNDNTYTNVAKAGLTILRGLNLISDNKYRTNIKQILETTETKIIEETEDKLLPRASVDVLINYINKCNSNESISFISPFYDENMKNKIKSTLKILIDLGLIEHDSGSLYKLTRDGFLFNNSIRTQKENEIFGDILFKNKAIQFIINQIIEKKIDDVDYKVLGKIIGEYNNVVYSDATKRLYGTNIISWLKHGKIIISNNTVGKYHINHSIIKNKKVSPTNVFSENEIIKKDTCLDLNNNLYRYYNWLLFSDNTITFHEEYKSNIIEILDKLIDTSENKDKIILESAKNWLMEGYSIQNKDYIKYSLKSIVALDINNK